MKPFDIREVIKKRVNMEAELEPENYERPLWKAPKKKKVKLTAGIINFCKQLTP